MVLVDQKKKNPSEETKGKLSIFEGRDSTDKEACLNLEKGISILESLTVGEAWDDSGRINLAVERLRKEPLQTWRLWRSKNTKDDWASLKESLQLSFCTAILTLGDELLYSSPKT